MDKTNLTMPSEANFQNRMEELERRARKDALSGLLNRATLEQCVREQLAAMGEEDTCALFIVDLDDFKRVNDTLGHQAGDKAIRQAAQVLSGIFCARDVVGRLGGDEFAVFLYGHITEKLVISKATAICEDLQLVLGDHPAVILTASVGVYLAGKGQAFEGLYRSADLALYKAKKAGKHRFYLKNGEGHSEGQSAVFHPVNSILISELLENMGSGVALLEMADMPQVIYASPSFRRIMGEDSESCPLPQQLSKRIHPDDLPGLLKVLREGLASDKTVEHSHRISVNDGTQWLWWHIRAMRIEFEAQNPVMLITAMDISKFKEKEQQKEEQIRCLQTALKQTSKQIWEVDIRNGTFRSYTRDGSDTPLGKGDMRFPEQLIEGGWVHPNCAARFRLFARELLGGCGNGFGNFAIRSGDTGYYSWASVSYRMLFDDAGLAVRAVGVLEELPRSFGGLGVGAANQQWLPESLVADLVMRLRANLDLDVLERLWEEGCDLSSQMQEIPCSQVLEAEYEKVFGKEDQKALHRYFDREWLQEQFASGRRWLCAEYRRTDRAGIIRWCRCVLYMTKDPVSHQIYLFMYLIWLDPRRQLESCIRGDHLRDPVTRLYSRTTIRRIAESLFKGQTGINQAVVILQVFGLTPRPEIPDERQIRYEIAAALALVMGGECVLGQYSSSQFVLVFPAVVSKENLRHRMEEGIVCLRQMLGPRENYQTLRFGFGAAVVSAETADYSAMLTQALGACSLQMDASSDMVTFAQEVDDWRWIQLSPFEESDRISIHSAEMVRPLSMSEKDAAFSCVTAMLTAKTLEASLTGALRGIGMYYQADRVYTLRLVENRSAVCMTFEWTSPGKRSIKQVMSGKRLDRFPILERCLAEQAPVILARKKPAAASGEPEKSWYFTAFPLIGEQQTEGFLCIENAREHARDAALIGTLIPYIRLERERFHARIPAGEERRDPLGRQHYEEAVPLLTSERFSALGAVWVEILPPSKEEGPGWELDPQLSQYVEDTLKELFGASLSFCIWETEFAAFLPNTTREVFLRRCGRLRAILQRRYPKRIRVGRAWAKETFTGRKLVEQIKTTMKQSFADMTAEIQEFSECTVLDPAGITNVRGRFIVYLQPKIDMRTGRLSGAEALVRGIADDGSIVLPSQFIELLEEDGAIRKLDLMVLERSLAQVDQWIKAGLGIVPVAVNLSRVTIAHPSTLASVLALQSRYPAVPPDALELEITERGKDVDNAEFRQIVDRFHACGLRLGLDDFGSNYANLPLFTSVKFDTVKLDRSLITEVTTNPISRALVQDIVRICQRFHMTCIAEGVESEEQALALLDMGCDLAQGFYYGQPMPMEEFEQKYLRPTDAPAQREEEKEEHL